MNNQERILATIPKGSRNAIRITLRDNRSVDIRQFEPNGLRVLMPTMKGVSFDLAALPILIAALETIKTEGQSWN